MTSTGGGPRDPSRRGVAMAGIVALAGCSVYGPELLDGRRAGGATAAAASTGGGGVAQVTSATAAGSGGVTATTSATGGTGSSPSTTGTGAAEAGTSAGAGGASGSAGAGNMINEPANEAGVDAPPETGVVDAPEHDADGRDAGQEAVHPVCALGECKLVFVSASAVTADAGSAAAFDARCQAFARARGLSGEWRAWVSDGRLTVAARMMPSAVRYRLLDGSTIANDWNDLTGGTLRHPIDVREDGTPSPPVEVWTATAADGHWAASLACGDWTAFSGTAIVGQSDMTTYAWTFARQQYCSAAGIHLYCFEQ